MATHMRQLNVSITPYFSKFIHRKVKSGRYSNASEVVRDALRRLEQEEELREQAAIVDPDNLYGELLKAEQSLDRGEGIVIRNEAEANAFVSDIIARGEQRLKAENKKRKR